MSPAPDPRRLKLYLLGTLPPEDAEALEDRYFQEGPDFEELLLAEDELIDEYVGGSLAPGERTAFEAAFLSSPGRRERVEFARALQRAASGAIARPGASRMVLLAAAAVVASLALAGWVTLRLRAAEAEIRAASSEVHALQAEVERLRTSGARLAQDIAAAARPVAGILTWAPSAGLTRGASPEGPLVLGRDVEWVRLRLPVDRKGALAVEIQTPEGRVAWSQPALPAEPPGLDAMVPARALAPGTYLVLLKSANGTEAGSFPLRVAASR